MQKYKKLLLDKNAKVQIQFQNRKKIDMQFLFSFDDNNTDQITFIQSNDENYIIFSKRCGFKCLSFL